MIKLVRRNIFSIFREYPKNIDLSSTSGSFKVPVPTISHQSCSGNIAKNCFLCLITIIPKLFPLESIILTTWSTSTGPPKQDGKHLDSSRSETCFWVLLFLVFIMAFSAMRERRHTKMTRGRSGCSDPNVMPWDSRSQQKESPCQTSTEDNSWT